MFLALHIHSILGGAIYCNLHKNSLAAKEVWSSSKRLCKGKKLWSPKGSHCNGSVLHRLIPNLIMTITAVLPHLSFTRNWHNIHQNCRYEHFCCQPIPLQPFLGHLLDHNLFHTGHFEQGLTFLQLGCFCVDKSHLLQCKNGLLGYFTPAEMFWLGDYRM